MNTLGIIRFVLSLGCTLIGFAAIISAVFGIFRFKTALNRIHAAALIDTVGVLFMILGVIIGQGFCLTSVKMIVIIGFLWITSPVASHLVARLEVTTNDELEKELEVKATDMVLKEKGGK